MFHKIAIVDSFESVFDMSVSGGQQRIIFHEVRHLLSMGYDLKVFVSKITGKPAGWIYETGRSEHHEKSEREKTYIQTISSIVSSEYDIVLCHGAYDVALSVPEKSVISLHCKIGAAKEKLKKVMESGIPMIFPSEFLKNYFFGPGKTSANLLNVIYPGVPQAFRRKRSTSRSTGKPLNIGYIGVWHPIKGLLECVNAVKILDEGGMKFVFHLVGDTDVWNFGEETEYIYPVEEQISFRRKIIEVIDTLDKNKAVLYGKLPHDRVADVLDKLDILVFPSLWEESFGLVIAEAMACGVCPVASNIGAVPEIVQHLKNGLLISPGEVKGIVNSIVSLNRNRHLLHTFQDRAYIDSEKRYSWEKHVSELLDVFGSKYTGKASGGNFFE